MVLYYNNDRENGKNTIYPYEAEISSPEDLEKVMHYDHMCAKCEENHRKGDNFISADCSMFDVDNTDSDVSAPVIKCRKKVIQDKKRPFFDNYTRKRHFSRRLHFGASCPARICGSEAARIRATQSPRGQRSGLASLSAGDCMERTNL